MDKFKKLVSATLIVLGFASVQTLIYVIEHLN